jgi:hypothetical protein
MAWSPKRFVNVVEDLYAVRGSTLRDVVALLEKLLMLKFEERDGEYRGGKYFRTTFENAELALQSNYIPFTESWLASEFRVHPLILLASGVDIASLDRLRDRLEVSTGVQWLRRESSLELLEGARGNTKTVGD